MTVEELRERLRHVTPSAWYGVIDEIISASHAEGVEEGESGIMSCPLYTHGWANDDDRRGEVHCCNRKRHQMSWNPEEMERECKKAGIDPSSVLAPKEQGETKETAFDKAGVTLRGQHGMDW
jgi:hypothetical protein